MSFAFQPGMHFRYQDSRGKVVRLADVTWLAQAVRNGLVTPDTPFAVGDDPAFRRAELVVSYQQVVVGLERNRLGTAPPVRAASAEKHPPGRSPARPWVVALIGAFAVAIGFFTVRSATPARGGVAAIPAPGPEMRVALAALLMEFGDSVAIRQHRLEQWVALQRFDQRLQGSGLTAPASLRATRTAAASYLRRVDVLVAGVSVLASRLILRADSLEGTDGVREGLFAAAGDVLREWEQDFSVYAGMQRATAATLDSLAQFTLERQQSFALRAGRPVFLSRSDAARARGLVDALDELAGKKERWAEQILAKHPQWIAFRRAPLQRSNQ